MNDLKTLFLDRDGVLNNEKTDDYIKSAEEFIFLPGALEAMKILNNHFERVILVTNQRGIGKGLMSLNDLQEIHNKMLKKIKDTEGKIDRIYFATDVDSCSLNRKPNIGMALQAKEEFPDIEFSTSVMVGNSFSDMQFGKRLGMTTVLVGNKYTQKEREKEKNLFDFFFNDLLSYALSL